MYGWRLFLYSPETSCPQLFIFYYVHGSYEYRSAIVEESTLSFMGFGLPLEIISWGSMLSLSEKALLTDGWWIILIPGAFLVVTLLAITGLGDYLRKELNKKESYL